MQLKRVGGEENVIRYIFPLICTVTLTFVKVQINEEYLEKDDEKFLFNSTHLLMKR